MPKEIPMINIQWHRSACWGGRPLSLVVRWSFWNSLFRIQSSLPVRIWSFAFAFALPFLAGSAQAAFDAYLLLPSISGEATDEKHLNWIRILSFSQSQGHSIGAVREQFADLTLIKRVDQASPLLMLACARSQPFATARLQLVHLDPRRLVFYDIQLSNVLVSALSACHRIADSNAPPLENLSLNFKFIAWTYTAFGPPGLPVEIDHACWDIFGDTGGSSITPAFRIIGLQEIKKDVTVNWTGQAGKTYQLLSSPLAQGPYTFEAQATASSNGPASVAIPLPGAIQFYWMRQLP